MHGVPAIEGIPSDLGNRDGVSSGRKDNITFLRGGSCEFQKFGMRRREAWVALAFASCSGVAARGGRLAVLTATLWRGLCAHAMAGHEL